MLVRVARLLARDRVVTEEEVELWVQYVGPVWKGRFEWMNKALAEWHAELVQCWIDLEETVRGRA